MTESRRKVSFVRVFGIAILVIVLIAAGVYYYVRSEHFITRVVLPRAGRAIDGTVTVESVSFQPFSGLRLHGLVIGDGDAASKTALFTVDSVIVRYRLLSFLSGGGIVESLEIVGPKVTIDVDANGRSNLDFLLDRKAREEMPPRDDAEGLSFPAVTIASARVTDGSFTYTEVDAEGLPVRDYRASGIEISLADFSPGAASVLSLAVQGQARDATRHIAITSLGVSLKAGLTIDEDAGGGRVLADMTVDGVTGTLGDNVLDDFSLLTKCGLTIGDEEGIAVDPFSLEVRQGATTGGSITSNGHFNPKSGEGEFSVRLDRVNKTLLNVLGALIGDIDFRETTLSNTVTVSITEGGRRLRSAGNLELSSFSVLARDFSSQPTEPLDFSLVYESDINQETGLLDVAVFDVRGRQNNREIVSGGLDRPLQLHYKSAEAGPSQAPLPDIAYNLRITGLDVTQFQPFLPLQKGTKLTSALLGTDLAVLFQQGGRRIGTQGTIELTGLRGEIGGTAIPASDLAMTIQASLTDMDTVRVEETRIRIKPRDGQPGSLVLNAEAAIAAGAGSLDIQFDKLDIAPLAPFIASDKVELRRGIVNGRSTIRATDAWRRIEGSGDIEITGFSGRLASFALTNFGLKTSFETVINGFESISFSPLKVEMKPGGRSSGMLELTGTADTAAGTARMTVAMTGMTERVVNIMLRSIAEDVTCQSVLMDYQGDMTASGGFSQIVVQGTLTTRDMLFLDRKSGKPLHQKIDIAIDHRLTSASPTIALEKCLLTMKTANTAPEKVTLTGQLRAIENVQTSPGVTSQATLTVTSDKLTVDTLLLPLAEETASTPAGTGEEAGTGGVMAPAGGRKPDKDAAGTGVERPPLAMAWLEATFDCSIRELHYRRMNMSGFTANGTLKKNVITVKPLVFTMDGGSFDGAATIDAGVPGWSYEISSTVKNLPLTPITESFMPTMSDRVTGTANASLTLAGIGLTLESMQRNLGGAFRGDLVDGVIRQIPILEELASVLNIKELRALKFFRTTIDTEIRDGQLQVKTAQLIGAMQKIGLEGWIGLDQRISLNLLVALADPLDRELRKVPQAEALLTTRDGYTELPVPIGFKGTLSLPKAILDLGPALEKKGTEALKGLFDKELNKFLDKQSGKNKPKDDTPQPTPTPAETTDQETAE